MIMTTSMVGEETYDGRICYKIKMVAKEDAAVIWGHQIRWIDKKDFLFLRNQNSTTRTGYLIRTELGSGHKNAWTEA
jgi:hypothetical protein